MNLREVRQREIQKYVKSLSGDRSGVYSIEDLTVETSFKDTIADLETQGY